MHEKVNEETVQEAFEDVNEMAHELRGLLGYEAAALASREYGIASEEAKLILEKERIEHLKKKINKLKQSS